MKKFLILVSLNLIFGNIFLYVHEIYGRQQAEVASSLWLGFSIASIATLCIAYKFLIVNSSALLALVLSLGVSYLIPLIGFFVAMQFSLIALLVGSAYLFYGFTYLVLPMSVLNYFLFRRIQKKQD